jgi:hypothetical protein
MRFPMTERGYPQEEPRVASALADAEGHSVSLRRALCFSIPGAMLFSLPAGLFIQELLPVSLNFVGTLRAIQSSFMAQSVMAVFATLVAGVTVVTSCKAIACCCDCHFRSNSIRNAFFSVGLSLLNLLAVLAAALGLIFAASSLAP